MSWDVYNTGTRQADMVESISMRSWQPIGGRLGGDPGRPIAGDWGARPLPHVGVVEPIASPKATTTAIQLSNGVTKEDDNRFDIRDPFGGILDLFKGFLGGNPTEGSLGAGIQDSPLWNMWMMSQMFGGGRGGGFGGNNMLMWLMLSQSGMFGSGGMLGTAAANPMTAMMLPRMGKMKALMLGGPELMFNQMMFKPAAPRRRRRYYPRRRYYRRRRYW